MFYWELQNRKKLLFHQFVFLHSMNKPIVIGISGGSGSGKTCFVHDVKNHFTDAEVSIISMDNYYHPRTAQKKDKNGIYNFDLPTSLDSKAFANDLKSLIKGKEVKKDEYVFNNPKKKAKELIFKSAAILLVEGLFIFHYKPIARLLDYKIFINTAKDLKVIRRIKRDGIERNYPMDDVLYRYDKHVSPSYKAYIAPYADDADISVNNFEDYTKGLDIVTGFISSKLR